MKSPDKPWGDDTLSFGKRVFQTKLLFKNLKRNVSDAIKESCYVSDARIYNIANEVVSTQTMSIDSGVETTEGLTRIIEKAIKDTVGIGCDLSVVVKGILLGSFRSNPTIAQEAHKTIRHLIKEILQAIFKFNGGRKQTVEGMYAAIYIVTSEQNLNFQEALKIVKEDILTSAKDINPEFGEEIKAVLPNL